MADTYFDRRIAPELMSALQPGGLASSLVEFGRSGQYCLDLQLRRNPKAKRSWATLYSGTTKILDLILLEHSSRMRLSAHATYADAKHGWDDRWTAARTGASLAKDWPRVETYLEQVIQHGIGSRYGKEGRIQSSLSLYPATDLVVIDRETVIGHTDGKARERVTKQHLEPLMRSVAHPSHGQKWWKPKPPGNECDGLAISSEGAVVSIEVKPADVSGVLWAPLQAIHYSNLMKHWIDETDGASDVLLGMYQQRLDLGLVRDPGFTPDLALPLSTKAVVAIGGDLKPVWRDRLRQVADRLSSEGHDVDHRRVNLVGRMDPLELG